MGLCLVTHTYVIACVALALLVHTQRVAPAAITLPTSASEALFEPWRAVGAFCYANDGLTPMFALRVHLVYSLSLALERACSLPDTQPSPLLLSGSALYAVLLVLACGVIGAATSTRPSELGSPFQLGQIVIFLSYVVSRLPKKTMLAVGGNGGVGLPVFRAVPYLLVIACVVAYGAPPALHLFAGLGAGVLFDCLDLLPVPKAEVGKTPAAAAAPADAAGGRSMARSWRLLVTLGLGSISLGFCIAGLEARWAPPVLPAAKYMRLHGHALHAATAVPRRPPAGVAAYFDTLALATNLSATRFEAASPSSESERGEEPFLPTQPKPLGAGQLLKLYQHVVDEWHVKLRDVRSPPSTGNLRAKGSGKGKPGVPELTDAEAAEMERLLSDALSRAGDHAMHMHMHVRIQMRSPAPVATPCTCITPCTCLCACSCAFHMHIPHAHASRAADFASTLSDRDVLKALLKTLTPTQAATMARMPRERLLETVGTHRESHRVAHEALGRLGVVLEELVTAKLRPPEGETPSDGDATVAVEVEAGGEVANAAAEGVGGEGGDGAAGGEGDGEDGGGGSKGGDLGRDLGRPLSIAEQQELEARLLEGLNETLSAFAIPLEMGDGEVVHEVLAGTSTERSMPSAHRAYLRQLVHDTRTTILERFISTSVRELRALLLSVPPPQDPPKDAGQPPSDGGDAEGADPAAESVDAGADDGSTDGGAAADRPALNSTEHDEALELAVELLLHHDIDLETNNSKISDDLVELLELQVETPADGNETDETAAADGVPADTTLAAAAASGAVRTRAGCHALLVEAAVEWRRQKVVQDAASAARALLLAEQQTEVDASIGTLLPPASDGSGQQVASPPVNLSALVATGLAGCGARHAHVACSMCMRLASPGAGHRPPSLHPPPPPPACPPTPLP